MAYLDSNLRQNRGYRSEHDPMTPFLVFSFTSFCLIPQLSMLHIFDAPLCWEGNSTQQHWPPSRALLHSKCTSTPVSWLLKDQQTRMYTKTLESIFITSFFLIPLPWRGGLLPSDIKPHTHSGAPAWQVCHGLLNIMCEAIHLFIGMVTV